MNQWFLIEDKSDYVKATTRYEQLRDAPRGSALHKEMLLLALLINQYEQKQWSLPEVDPIEMIKIRMEDFGLTASDLAKTYGDKGTVSKVLNYKQPLSLTMIRKFSKLLHIPSDALTKEYKLKQ